MKSTTKCLAPALLVCLAAMVLTGFAAETPTANPGGKPKGVAAQPGDSTQATVKQMTAELKLTEDQQKKVKKILDANEQKMRENRANTKLTPQEFGTKGREVRAANDQQLREILTAEQYQQWQKILAQRATRRRPEAPPGAAPPAKASPPQTGSGPAEKR